MMRSTSRERRGRGAHRRHRAAADGPVDPGVGWTRAFHAAVTEFSHPGPWRYFPMAGPTLIGHNDIAPYSVCFVGDDLVGVFDWDMRDIGPERAARRLTVIASTYGGFHAREILHAVPRRIRSCSTASRSRRRPATRAWLTSWPPVNPTYPAWSLQTLSNASRRSTGHSAESKRRISLSGPFEGASKDSQQGVADRKLVPCVERDQRNVGVDRQSPPYVVEVVGKQTVEEVHGDHERKVDRFEIVDGGITIVQTPGVHDDEGAERTLGQVPPHEAETVLTRRPENVQLEIFVDGDAAEVEGHGGRGLVGDLARAVDLRCHGRDRRFGTHRRDLRYCRYGRCLAYPEAARNDDLHRYGRHRRSGGLVSGWLRVHGSPFRSGPGLGRATGLAAGRRDVRAPRDRRRAPAPRRRAGPASRPPPPPTLASGTDRRCRGARTTGKGTTTSRARVPEPAPPSPNCCQWAEPCRM